MASSLPSQRDSSGPSSLPSEEQEKYSNSPADLEAQGGNKNGANTQKDPNLVAWDGPDDLENPNNWPDKTK
jgi:hypothetical protein